jgi:hypothetical protein
MAPAECLSSAPAGPLGLPLRFHPSVHPQEKRQSWYLLVFYDFKYAVVAIFKLSLERPATMKLLWVCSHSPVDGYKYVRAGKQKMRALF